MGDVPVVEVTKLAVMFTSVVAAGGSLWLVLRLVSRAPRFVDQWLDQRAAEHARAQREARAVECLIRLQPTLTAVAAQLGPNGGQSLYDLVHQADAGLSELRAWVRAHVEGHDDLDAVLGGLSGAVDEIKRAVEPEGATP